MRADHTRIRLTKYCLKDQKTISEQRRQHFKSKLIFSLRAPFRELNSTGTYTHKEKRAQDAGTSKVTLYKDFTFRLKR